MKINTPFQIVIDIKMIQKVYLFFTVLIIIITLSNVLSHNLNSTTSNQNYYNAFKGFSTDMLCLAATEISETRTFGSYSLGVVHIMSLINQQVWKMKTDGFEKALRIPLDNITLLTHSLLHILQENDENNKLEDPNIKFQSIIYTPNKDQANTFSPIVLKELDTKIQFIEKDVWETSTLLINKEVQKNTNQMLDGNFIPQGGWFGPNLIQYYTRALFINTLTYEHKWDAVKINITNTYGEVGSGFKYSGNIGFVENDKLFAYSIPLKNDSKKNKQTKISLVLVQLKIGIQEFIKIGIKNLFNIDRSIWQKKNIQLEVPLVNLSLPATSDLQLQKLGIKNTFCKPSEKRENFLQRIAQNLHVYIGSSGVQFAAATGVVLNNYKEFAEALRISPSSSSHSNSQNPTDNKPICLDCQCTGEDNESKHRSGKAKEQTQFNQTNINIVTLKTPFLFYLDHLELGPIYLGLINSLEKEEVSSDDLGLGDIVKYSTWSCP